MNNYKISDAGLAFIQHEEGCKLRAYKDQVGVWTIGVGHTGTDVKPGMSITNAQAMELLRADVAKCEATISKLVKVALNQKQIDSLCSLVFNIGVGAFAKSTLLKLINASASEDMIYPGFTMWCKGTINGQKVVLPVLKGRRVREANMFFS